VSLVNAAKPSGVRRWSVTWLARSAPPGVHLEVQVAAVLLRLEKDLDAAVLVHGIAEVTVPGEDVAVLDAEDPAEAVLGV
jgi:hypothetical protein